MFLSPRLLRDDGHVYRSPLRLKPLRTGEHGHRGSLRGTEKVSPTFVGMIKLRSAPAVLILLLAACETLPSAPGSSGPGHSASCTAEALSVEFVGQDASVIFATTFTAPIRVIRPGDAVTEDFNPARINFVLNANERVTEVYCG